MEYMLSLSVLGHLRRIRIGEDNMKGDDIVECFIFCYLPFIFTSSMRPSLLAPRQTWRLTCFGLNRYLIVFSCPSKVYLKSAVVPKYFLEPSFSLSTAENDFLNNINIVTKH